MNRDEGTWRIGRGGICAFGAIEVTRRDHKIQLESKHDFQNLLIQLRRAFIDGNLREKHIRI